MGHGGLAVCGEREGEPRDRDEWHVEDERGMEVESFGCYAGETRTPKLLPLEKHTKSRRRAQCSLKVLCVIGKNRTRLCEILATKN